MLIVQDAQVSPAQDGAVSAAEAAARLVRPIPADQALGLRLIAMARAAAAVHMAAVASPEVRGSQAAGLLREVAR